MPRPYLLSDPLKMFIAIVTTVDQN